MKRTCLASLLVFALLVSPAWGEEADSDNPHLMVKPDGEPDSEKCMACHEEDMSLTQSKSESCIACHSTTTHAGIEQHLAADAAAVARRALKTSPLPLTDEGTIYCGTCHLIHDPTVNDEPLLAERWLPIQAGLPQFVRQSLEERWAKESAARGKSEPGASFSTRGTTYLRLPINDGTLCQQCHQYAK